MTEYIVLREGGQQGADGPLDYTIVAEVEHASARGACREVAEDLDEDSVILYAVPKRNWQRHAFNVETQRRVVGL